jgi:hypothetical protein
MTCVDGYVCPLQSATLLFIAQNVTLDVCSLEQDMSLLQQGCDITGGLYLRIPQLQGLLQYLLVCYHCFVLWQLSIHKMRK